MSIAKNAIHKIRRLAMHPSWAPSVDGAAHSLHIILWVKRLCWFERTAFQTAKIRNVSRLGSQFLGPQEDYFPTADDSLTCRSRYAQSSPGPAGGLDEEIHCDLEQ